jgi:hypothetical protein
MKYPRYLVALAVVLGLALAGCQPTAPLMAGSSASAHPSSSEFAAIIQTAVEDRNSSVLDAPRAARLDEGRATADYRSKRERDLLAVARAKDGFKSMGFWYTSFSTTVTVDSVEVSGSEASVRFKEVTEQYQASTANGPSSVPSSYSLPQTATFQANGDGWQLDSIVPVEHGGGLPMSVVEG